MALLRGRKLALIMFIGLVGAALVYGDATITPAISVMSAQTSNMKRKLVHGKVWVPDSVHGGYGRLPDDDPKYVETLLWIDSQRFVELLDWVYNREKLRKR